jgi:predicted lipoprotein with Yx(FWY)xxD motif
VSKDVRVKMRGLPFVLAALAVTVLAACGSSGSKATDKASPSKPSTTTTAASTTTGSAPVVETASNAKFGTILVDAKGMTLYTLTKDGAPVECTGVCLTAWPPLLLPAGSTTATGAEGVTGLGTVAAAGGTQVTLDGAPLYHFSADTSAGAANGEGISSFGGVWHVVKITGASGADTTATSGTTGTTTPDTTTSDPYGY